MYKNMYICMFVHILYVCKHVYTYMHIMHTFTGVCVFLCECMYISIGAEDKFIFLPTGRRENQLTKSPRGQPHSGSVVTHCIL